MKLKDVGNLYWAFFVNRCHYSCKTKIDKLEWFLSQSLCVQKLRPFFRNFNLGWEPPKYAIGHNELSLLNFDLPRQVVPKKKKGKKKGGKWETTQTQHQNRNRARRIKALFLNQHLVRSIVSCLCLFPI